MTNVWNKISCADIYNAMKNMTPAERFLEVEKSRQALVDTYIAKVQSKEQEIIKCIKSIINDYITEYQDTYGQHYREKLDNDKAYCWIGENDEFLNHIKEYMELLYD